MRTMLISARTFVAENKKLLICFLLFFLIAKIYAPCCRYGFANYDDSDYAYGNSHVTSGLTLSNVLSAFTSTTSANWHPLTMLSLMLDCQFHGVSPKWMHFTNVILHSFNTILLFLFMERITGTVGKSFLVALFFGLHPLRVESVVWISERKDVLSVMFCLLAALAYSKYVVATKLKNAKRGLYYTLTLLWFLFGLMSKPMLVTFPCILLLLDFWPLERWRSTTLFSLVKEKIPLFLLSGIISVAAFSTQGQFPLREMPYSVRLGNMSLSYCRYIGKILYPVNLALFYPYPMHWPAARIILSILLLVIICIVVIMVWRNHPYVLVGWLWFLGTLFPVIGITQVGSQSMADRYSYIPSIGIFIVLVWAGGEMQKRWNVAPRTLWLVVVAIVVTCGVVTRRQISYWRTNETLWRHAAEVTEKNYIAYALIGCSDMAKTNYNAAITNFENSLKIRGDKADVRIWLGQALIKVGRADEAIKTLQGAIVLNENSAQARTQMALALLVKGRRDEAVTNLNYALKLQPDYLEAKEELSKLTNSSYDAAKTH